MLQRFTQKFLDMKFRRKLLISYILLSIIPITVLGLHSYRQAKALLIDKARTSIEHSVIQAVQHMDNGSDKFNSVSDYISFDENIINALNSSYEDNYYDMYYSYTNVIDPIFNSMMFLQPDISQMTVYNSGNLVRHGTLVLPIEDISSKAWFSRINKSYDNTWIYDAGEIIIVRRIISANTSVSNFLSLTLKYNNIFKELKEITDNYGLYVVDNNGQVVYNYENFSDNNMKYILTDQQLIKKSDNQNKNQREKYIIMNESLNASNWKVVFYKPIDTLHFDVSSIIKAVFLAIAICIIMLLVFSLIFSKLIVNRIELLTYNIKCVDENNLKNIITSTDKDEIGKLIRSFEGMMKKIDTLISEVYESELKKKEAEMIALQAQINPHFLYNVLSSINWKAIMINANEISRTAQLLASFYRTALNGGKNIIGVKEELENTKSYIEIQSILHNGSFITIYDIDEEIYNYQIIKLLLQPIVENAIEHGLDCKKSGEKILQVTAGINDRIMLFKIQDNGPGLEKEVADKLLNVDSKGYGLKNVNERIKLYYGEEYGVNIESTVNVGTSISIMIPIP